MVEEHALYYLNPLKCVEACFMPAVIVVYFVSPTIQLYLSYMQLCLKSVKKRIGKNM